MAIQILGLRDNPRNPTRKRTVFFSNGWRANSVNEIFEKISSIIEKIPAPERVNMYYTVADCFEEDGRKLREQHVIPFDIDGLAGETTEDVRHQGELAARAICEAIGVNYNQCGVVFSGNGVQILLQITAPILSDDYFTAMRAHYKVVTDRMQSKLVEKGLSGKMDTSVFSGGRLMRLPNTLNQKPNKPTRMAEILNGTMAPQAFYLDQASGITEMEKADQIRPDVIKRYPEPDAKAVMDGCLFIKHCFEHAKDISEPQWYAAASVVVRLYKDEEKSKQLFHKMSEPHASYNYYEADLKANQALENSGPRTCKNIDSLWDGCKACPHYSTSLISPILIHGPDYIKSKDHGFREMKENKNGDMVPGRPAYEDLIKQFGKEYEFLNMEKQDTMYVMGQTHWSEFNKKELKAWVTGKVVPPPSVSEMNEFMGRIDFKELKNDDWITGTTEGVMNFSNGVLNLDTMQLSTHSSVYGFMHVIPYIYDHRATCPKWDKFMLEITEDNQETVDLLTEFGGYAIAGGECAAQKALLMLGEGANGKSIWAETLARVVGEKNFTSIPMEELKKDQMRATLNHKLFNYSDEGGVEALRNSPEYKTMVTGGYLTGKELWKQPYTFKNKAKLILLTNNLPNTNDTSDGFFRRLLIVKFNRQFTGAADNKNLRHELWEELPGICNRFIEGFIRLKANGYVFTMPEVVERALENYRREVNYAGRFAGEELELTGGQEAVSYPEIFSRYQTWCMATGQKNTNDKTFFKDLRRSRVVPEENFIRVKEGGRNISKVKGVRLLAEF